MAGQWRRWVSRRCGDGEGFRAALVFAAEASPNRIVVVANLEF